MMGYYGYGVMGFGMIMMAVMGVIAVLVIVALVRYIQRSGGSHANSNINNSALSILDERYAKGEISDEEYKKKKTEILRR
jgi:putative membrane protein